MSDSESAGGSGDGRDVSRGDSPPEDRATLGNQALTSVGEGSSDAQELPPGMSAGSFAPSSQDLKVDEPKSSSSEDVSTGASRSGPHSPNLIPGGEQSTSGGGNENMYDFSNPVRLLLTVLEEIMERNDEMKCYSEFCDRLNSISKNPDEEKYVMEDLYFYVDQIDTIWRSSGIFRDEHSVEYRTEKRYYALAKLVVKFLINLVPWPWGDLEYFENTMDLYVKLKKKYEKFIEYWREEQPGEHVADYKQTTERFLLQTRNAFREFFLLLKLEGDIEQYDAVLFPDDIRFIRGPAPLEL